MKIQKSKIDLHGVFHSEVFDVVDQFINESIVSGKTEVEIITGYSPRMKELVREVLSDYNLTGKEPVYNSGTLIVNMLT